MVRNSKQKWEIGSTVKVGFLSLTHRASNRQGSGFLRELVIAMTNAQIREFFDLDESADLDKPRADLGFESYREVAQAHFEKWGVVS